MLVDRRTFLVRKGSWDQALTLIGELARDTHARLGVTARAYASFIGPFDTVAIEFEVPSLGERERLEQLYGEAAGPAFAAWFERWQEVTAPGGAGEIWQLIDEH
jgi:hypothetical protein